MVSAISEEFVVLIRDQRNKFDKLSCCFLKSLTNNADVIYEYSMSKHIFKRK